MLGFSAAASLAHASLTIMVDKSTQQLTVKRDGVPLYVWPVSTGRAGLPTPSGSYAPVRMERKWYSRQYDNAPMPYSIFFHDGYAIHGSYETDTIGEPVSHGCVRLSPQHAKILFGLVREEGTDDTKIVIRGKAPQIYVAQRNLPSEASGQRVVVERMPRRQSMPMDFFDGARAMPGPAYNPFVSFFGYH